jgi:hypothetical protein
MSMVTEQAIRTLTTSKGRSIETSLSDMEAYAICKGITKEFAQSLTHRPLAKLSDDQLTWLHILAVEASAPKAPKAPKPQIDLKPDMESAWQEYLAAHEWFDGESEIIAAHRAEFEKKYAENADLSNLFGILESAAKSLKFPKVRILAGDRVIVLKASKGLVYISDANEEVWNDYRQESAKRYFGKVDAGIFFPVKNCPPEIEAALRAFATDPLAEAKRYGKATGHCSFCGRQLTDQVSVANGYGPICARKYGLA